MNFEELKTQIAEIVSICSGVPEEFRARCFEILLAAAIQQHKRPERKDDAAHNKADDHLDEPDDEDEKPTPWTIPGHVKAFLRRQELSDGLLEKLVMLDGEELHWLKEPTHKNVRKGQSEWALLLALKSALLGKTALSVDPEDVRSAAQDKGYYDKGNFAKNFKQDPYQTWYKGEMVPQGAAQTLSKEGEAALAELIKALTGN
jgi:hypothetical protein